MIAACGYGLFGGPLNEEAIGDVLARLADWIGLGLTMTRL